MLVDSDCADEPKNDSTNEFARLFKATFHFHVWGNKHHLSADDQQ